MAFKLIKKEIKSTQNISNESFMNALLENHLLIKKTGPNSELVEEPPVRNNDNSKKINSRKKDLAKNNENKDILVDNKSIPQFFEKKINFFDDEDKSKVRDEVISDIENSIIKTKAEENIVDRRKRKKT
jgi:hypothetical protein